jgi:hypothetical protein
VAGVHDPHSVAGELKEEIVVDAVASCNGDAAGRPSFTLDNLDGPRDDPTAAPPSSTCHQPRRCFASAAHEQTTLDVSHGRGARYTYTIISPPRRKTCHIRLLLAGSLTQKTPLAPSRPPPVPCTSPPIKAASLHPSRFRLSCFQGHSARYHFSFFS